MAVIDMQLTPRPVSRLHRAINENKRILHQPVKYEYTIVIVAS